MNGFGSNKPDIFSLKHLKTLSRNANRQTLDYLKSSSLPRHVCHWLMLAAEDLAEMQNLLLVLAVVARSAERLRHQYVIYRWIVSSWSGANLKTGAIRRGPPECASVDCNWNCSQAVRLRGKWAGPMGLCCPAALWWRALDSACAAYRSELQKTGAQRREFGVYPLIHGTFSCPLLWCHRLLSSAQGNYFFTTYAILKKLTHF